MESSARFPEVSVTEPQMAPIIVDETPSSAVAMSKTKADTVAKSTVTEADTMGLPHNFGKGLDEVRSACGHMLPPVPPDR